MGKPTLAGALLLVLRNEKQKLKKKEREERDQKTCFSNTYQKKGRLWRRLKTEVKKERVKKWALSFF